MVSDILVLLLNGRTADAALASEYAEKLMVRGVRIIAVPMGIETESFEDQAELVASSLQDMRKTSFDNLYEIGNYVLSALCTSVQQGEVIQTFRANALFGNWWEISIFSAIFSL